MSIQFWVLLILWLNFGYFLYYDLFNFGYLLLHDEKINWCEISKEWLVNEWCLVDNWWLINNLWIMEKY